MELPELCRQIIVWLQNGKSENFPDGATLLRDGPRSIACIPRETPDRVVKIIKSGRAPRGLSIDEEFAFMQEIEKLEGELYVTPRGLSWGEDPSYLEMTRLGTSFDSTQLAGEADRIGMALGEFAGKLYLKHQAIHDDIYLGNYTNSSDGKIGIVDLASVRKTNVPEKMFLMPLLDPINVCPAMASKFEEVTGHCINFELVEHLSVQRMPRLRTSKSYEQVAEIIDKQNANLEEWRKLHTKKIFNYRPRLQKIANGLRRITAGLG